MPTKTYSASPTLLTHRGRLLAKTGRAGT